MKKQTRESKENIPMRNPSESTKFSCVDLFCGCGGLSLGTEHACEIRNIN